MRRGEIGWKLIVPRGAGGHWGGRHGVVKVVVGGFLRLQNCIFQATQIFFRLLSLQQYTKPHDGIYGGLSVLW